MADKPVGEVVAVDAVLDGLSSPTSSDVYEAMQPFSNDAVGAVAAKRALAGGGGGGGGLALARNVGQAEITFNGESRSGTTPSKVTFGFGDGDEALIDLTAPTIPTVVAAGVYAFTATVRADAPLHGAWSCDLLLDDNWYSINAKNLLSTANTDTTICAVWWCEADDPFSLSIGLDDVSAITFSGRLLVQRITA